MIGVTLRNKRKEDKTSLKKVAEATKIRIKYLEALEEENYEIFPAEVYLRGFLRTYANYLGLNGDELVKIYEQEHHEIQTKPEVSLTNVDSSYPMTETINRRKTGLVFVGIIAVIFILLVPEKIFYNSLLIIQERLPGKNLAEHNRQNEVLSLQAKVKAQTWVRIIADGIKVEERNFYPGEIKTWEAQNKFELKIGNVYGLDLRLNGKLIDIITPSKESVLDLKLDKGILSDPT